MIISTLVQARTLAAVLSFQLKRVLRGTPTLVGPYTRLPFNELLRAALTVAVGPEVRELLVEPMPMPMQTGGRFAFGQIDIVEVSLTPRSDYPTMIEPTSSIYRRWRREFNFVAPGFELNQDGPLNNNLLPVEAEESRNGVRVSVTLAVLLYDPDNLGTPPERVRFRLDLDVFPHNLRTGAGRGLRPELSLVIRPGSLVLGRFDQTREYDLYGAAQVEAERNRLALTGMASGPIITVVQDAYQQLVTPILAPILAVPALSPGGISRALSSVLNEAFGEHAILPLNWGARVVRSSTGQTFLRVMLQLTDGRMATDLVTDVNDGTTILFRRLLRDQTASLWGQFFTAPFSFVSSHTLGLFVAKSLIEFLVVSSLGRTVDEVTTRATSARQREVNERLVNSLFTQTMATPEQAEDSLRYLQHYFGPRQCAVHDFLVTEQTDAGREAARRLIANTLKRFYFDPHAMTANELQLMSVLDSGCGSRTREAERLANHDRIPVEQAKAHGDLVIIGAVQGAYDARSRAVPRFPSPFEIYEAIRLLDDVDDGCLVRSSAIRVELSRGSTPYAAKVAVDQRFEKARRVVLRLEEPGPEMSQVEAREIVRLLDSSCSRLSVIRRLFPGRLSQYPVLPYEFERNQRLIARGEPGKQLSIPHVRNLGALFVGSINDYVIRRHSGPSVRWHQDGPQLEMTFFVQEPLGPLGTALRFLLLPTSIFAGGDTASAHVDLDLRIRVETHRVPWGSRSRVSAQSLIDADFSTSLATVLGISPLAFLLETVWKIWGQNFVLSSALTGLAGTPDQVRRAIVEALQTIFTPDVSSIEVDVSTPGFVGVAISGFFEALLGRSSVVGPQLTFPSLLLDPLPGSLGFTDTDLAVVATPFEPEAALRSLWGIETNNFRVVDTRISFGFHRACENFVDGYGLLIRIDFVLLSMFEIFFTSISFADASSSYLSPSIRVEHVFAGREGPRSRQAPLSPFVLFSHVPGDDNFWGVDLFIPRSVLGGAYSALVGQPARLFLAATAALPVIDVGVFPPLPTSPGSIVEQWLDCRSRGRRL